MKHIVLSYDHQDTEAMRRILAILRARELDIWTDENLESETAAWNSAIRHAIEEAAALIVLMSPAAKQSGRIDREIAYANANQVLICPVLVAGDEAAAVPFELIDWQWIDTRESAHPIKNILAPCLQHHLKTLSTSPNYLRLDAEMICKTPYAICTGSNARGAITIEQPTVDQLAWTLDFTLDELELNRTGGLSERQRRKLLSKCYASFWISLGQGIPAVYLGYQLLNNNLAAGTPTLHVVFWLSFCVLALLAIRSFLRSMAGQLQHVDTVIGQLTPISLGKLPPHVRVGDRLFPIPRERWDRLDDSYPGQYRAYYTRGILVLLSIEPHS